MEFEDKLNEDNMIALQNRIHIESKLTLRDSYDNDKSEEILVQKSNISIPTAIQKCRSSLNIKSKNGYLFNYNRLNKKCMDDVKKSQELKHKWQ